MMHKVFGRKEDAQYLDREGAYLIPYCNDCIGVVKTPKGYFLLGGGLEAGESHLDCIKRECMEEVGCISCVEGRLCSAEAYAIHSAIGYFHPIQTYYIGKLLDQKAVPMETDHELCWLEYGRIKGKMFAEMQNWALEQFAAYFK